MKRISNKPVCFLLSLAAIALLGASSVPSDSSDAVPPRQLEKVLPSAGADTSVCPECSGKCADGYPSSVVWLLGDDASACGARPPWAGGAVIPRESAHLPDVPATTDDDTIERGIDNPASIAVVVNKQRPLNPVTHVPEDLVPVDGQYLREEAAASYTRFQEAAASGGVAVAAASGYRSHDTQAGLYAGYAAQYGAETADTISARPGHSEHQTGLAVDIAVPDGTCSLQQCFAETAAGRWAAENAYRFGFIVRYPSGATPTTGYAYEPWHLRYVGSDIAAGIRSDNAATLEEFLRLPAAGSY